MIFFGTLFQSVPIIIIIRNQCTLYGSKLLNAAYWALGKLVRLQF